MSDVREKLEQLPPRLKGVGTKLLNWIEHTDWGHGRHADEALTKFADEVLRLRAHLGRREQYLLDETAIHPNLPPASEQQFGHAIHADTCSMCADDAKAFNRLQESADRSEAGRRELISGLHTVRDFAAAVAAGQADPKTTPKQFADTLLRYIDKAFGAHDRKWSK